MDRTEFNQMKQTFAQFLENCTERGYVCLFGSLSFPAQILRIEEEYIFTMQTSPVRFLGIPTDVAEAYLKRIKRTDVSLKNSAGMGSVISYDIHPLCFHKSLHQQYL